MLLGAISSSSRTASWVKDQISGFCRHQNAAVYDFRRGLNRIQLRVRITADDGVFPNVRVRCKREVISISFVSKAVANWIEPPFHGQFLQTFPCSLPVSVRR